jgi:predicted ABC-type ATPase
MRKSKPVCYIIAGPNGAGKTTFALQYLAEIAGCRNFINADLIAQGLSPLDSLAGQYEAGQLFLKEIYRNIDKRIDFAFETTLSGRSYINLFKKLKQNDWQLVLFFLWIPDANFSKSRIRERVKHGGHSISPDTIYRRYPRAIHNFVEVYAPLCDKVFCYDNSNPKPVLIFEQDEKGQKISVNNIYKKIIRCSNDYKRNK